MSLTWQRPLRTGGETPRMTSSSTAPVSRLAIISQTFEEHSLRYLKKTLGSQGPSPPMRRSVSAMCCREAELETVMLLPSKEPLHVTWSVCDPALVGGPCQDIHPLVLISHRQEHRGCCWCRSRGHFLCVKGKIKHPVYPFPSHGR